MSTGYSGTELTQILVHMLDLAINPGRLNNVFHIGDIVNTTIVQRNKDEAVDLIYRDAPGLADLFEEGYTCWHDLGVLSKMPVNTLGYAYSEHMHRNQLKALDYKEKEHDRYEFFFKRLRQTHDILHVVTGFPNDNLGEVGLEGFYLGQAMLPNIYYLMIARMSHILMSEKIFEAQQYLETLTKGFEMGKKAKKVLGLKWEEMWSEDMMAVRNQLGITV